MKETEAKRERERERERVRGIVLRRDDYLPAESVFSIDDAQVETHLNGEDTLPAKVPHQMAPIQPAEATWREPIPNYRRVCRRKVVSSSRRLRRLGVLIIAVVTVIGCQVAVSARSAFN